VSNFVAIALRGASPKYVKYYSFVTFLLSYLVLVILFFSQLCSGRTHRRILIVYGLNDALPPKNVSFGGMDDEPQFSAFKPPKNPKNGRVGIFQPNWQNRKIVISLTAKIGSTPNFERLMESHSSLRGWSK